MGLRLQPGSPVASLMAACALWACASAPPGPPADAGPPPTAAPTPPPPAPAAAQPVASASGAAPTPAPPKPTAPKKTNVIVITIDALRADHMPWLGYSRPVAPALSAFAAKSMSYTQAYSISSYTAMSMGGYLAGRYPSELKRSGYFFSAYPKAVEFFPERLRAAGIRTLAGHAHFYFDKKAGFEQAFDDYRIVPGLDKNNKTDKNVTSPAHLKLAKEMLGDPKNHSGQFFAWFHFMDPHDVYVEHDEYRFGRLGTKDRYDGEIRYTDEHVGKLLKWIEAQPWGEHTAIVISSDHGEAFGEHKRSRHGFELWQELVRVPMLIKVPGAKPGSIDTPRSHIDLAPTILALMGQPVPDAMPGKSLVEELRGATPEKRPVFVDLPRTSDNDRRRAMIDGHHKILAFGDDFRFKIFDLKADPGEKVDLKRREKALYKSLKKRYLERVKGIKDICPKMRKRLMGKNPHRRC